MQIRTITSPLLGAACHLVIDGERRCAVVDPGAGVVEDVLTAVARDRLRVVGILATHGHLDHTWSAAELSDTLGVPVRIHAEDAYRLADPLGSLGPLGAQLAALAPGLEPPALPRLLQPFTCAPDGTVLDLDGLTVGALHAPGHTQGSTVYLLGDATNATALTGDVLFAGTIGRTDLPGGDAAAMASTLARLARLDPATRILPGHGEASTIAAELATNPYLRAA